MSEEYLGLGGQEKLKDSDPSTEPREELREQAQRITDQINRHLEQEMVDLGVIRDEIIAPALAEKDAALAEAQGACVDLNRRCRMLEADLAAMRGALERLTDCAVSGINPDLSQARDHATALLSSFSPGAAWLATAREVVELAESVAADNCVATRVDMIADALDAAFPELAPRRPGCGQCRPCRARALLARPEVQRLW